MKPRCIRLPTIRISPKIAIGGGVRKYGKGAVKSGSHREEVKGRLRLHEWDRFDIDKQHDETSGKPLACRTASTNPKLVQATAGARKRPFILGRGWPSRSPRRGGEGRLWHGPGFLVFKSMTSTTLTGSSIGRLAGGPVRLSWLRSGNWRKSARSA